MAEQDTPPPWEHAPIARAFIDATARELASTLIALDVDGTVSEIVDAPERAVVRDELRATLDTLSRRAQLWFVSGRDATAVRRLVGIARAGYVGGHGLEVLDEQGLRSVLELEHLDESFDRIVRAVTADVPEVAPYVERKRFGVSFHYRAFPPPADIAGRLQRSVDRHLPPDLRLQPGKMVLDVVPDVERDKGAALRQLIDTLRPARALVAGDDRTDVPMLGALQERRARGVLDGLAVAVLHAGETPAGLLAVADVTAADVDGLHRLLESLLR